MVKKKILLSQPYLRVHILNFGQALKNFTFIQEHPPKYTSSAKFYRSQAGSTPQLEFDRNKISPRTRLRRLLGILNVRIKFTQQADLLFTYGCMLITNKPYCVYVENGVTIFSYDASIARNPIARLLFSWLVRLPQCKKLIFMSQTAKKSFLATTKLSPTTRLIVQHKSDQVYPFLRDPVLVKAKSTGDRLQLLFTGVFYMKGGRETINAFDRIREKSPKVSLTIVTPLHLLTNEDRTRMDNTAGLVLRDATLTNNQMAEMYRQHDIFLFPTFRDTFGLVLIEALSFGLPIIAVDQFAVTEMVKNNWNGFVHPNHPLTDYNRKTMETYGKLYNARDFYQALFSAEKSGKMQPIEDFLVASVSKYLADKKLLHRQSLNSLELYKTKFSEQIIGPKIERVFTEAVRG